MCQQNQSIPPQLFESSFCQPQIPDREFDVRMMEDCPSGAYGVCEGARTPGVAYQQSIHYYSEPDDTPVLRAYCEEISQGAWRALER
ncbi:NADH:ubiquinone oxidoreductase [Halopseudomonas nanhaiensis]|uniref:NADH:ubiquinone oxidoreductase n=1 Tax=Halopseudomonas nanhaiensis TaxID=2830842 RepID=UPI001CBEAD75|nr:NADH:ubiquinone oxidoreductase [Halopseudomonas nanhaiensis]UAW98392.1 NADH:ubiquinone oxidoreductase [Halopseudomonas nanhaiensis]